MKILYLTLGRIGDRSFGGGMRANYIYDALSKVAAVETLVIHGGPTFSLDREMDARGVRTAVISDWGLSLAALTQRRRVAKWVAQTIENGNYDLIVAQYVGIAGLVPSSAHDRLIFDADDFVKSPAPGQRPSIMDRVKLTARNMMARRLARRALHVWYSNPTPEHRPPSNRSSWLPNVVTLPDAHRAPKQMVRGRLLMVGFFAHRPNVEGLAWFYTNVWPDIALRVPDAEIHAIGRYDLADAAGLPDVKFHGYVEDLPGAYDSAALVIAPVISGGGTQIKVIDALAHGRPTVVSSFAHAGFADDLHHEDHLLVASSRSQWIEQCVWALQHPDLLVAMAERGEALVRSAYGPDRLELIVAQTISNIRVSGAKRH